MESSVIIMRKLDMKQSILVNLFITQLLIFVIGAGIIFFQKMNYWSAMFSFAAGWTAVGWGLVFALVVILVDLAMARWMPEDIFDDGGINQLIFSERKVWQIALLCLLIAVGEELLFRGAIQYAIGPYWTSVLFAAIHVRYLRHWILTGLVFCISYGLGWLYIQTGTLWTSIIAHFTIDFVMGCMIRFRREA